MQNEPKKKVLIEYNEETGRAKMKGNAAGLSQGLFFITKQFYKILLESTKGEKNAAGELIAHVVALAIEEVNEEEK